MNKLTTSLALAFAALCRTAAASIVPVEWDAAGQFNKEVTVAPGKFVEACEKLPKGATVAWSFEAGTPMEFNIHYHEGSDVRFPTNKSKVSREEGTLLTALAQDYCWMWTNKGAVPAQLRFKLQRR